MATIFNEQRVLGIRLVADGTKTFNNQPVIGVKEASVGVNFVDNLRVLGVEVLPADKAIHNDQPVLGAVLIADARTLYNNQRVIPSRSISGVPVGSLNSIYWDIANDIYWTAGKYDASLAAHLASTGGSFTRSTAASFVDASLSLTDAAINAPRIDFEVTKSLLYEGAATNLLIRSNSLDAADWLKTGVVAIADDASGPFGTLADTVREDTSTGLHRTLLTNLTANAGQSYAYAVDAKAAGRRYLYINGTARINAGATFDLQTGTVAAIAAGVAFIIPLGNGWYRCIVIGTPAATTTGSIYLQLNTTPTAADDNYTGTSAGISFRAAQLEAGSVTTSRIATDAATASRGADALTIALPAGNHNLTVTFDNDSTQVLPNVSGNYALPANLNRSRIKRIAGVAA